MPRSSSVRDNRRRPLALSEDDLIARHFAPLAGEAGLGLRDDAALLTPPPGTSLVLTKDMLVAGVHFFADDPPDAIARKALRVNLSDLAAKAAEPLGFLLGLALPGPPDDAWLENFARGLGEDARAYACPLLGGDTVATPGPLTVSITALGAVPASGMTRRGAVEEGDVLFVSGAIGDAALGLRLRLRAPQDLSWIERLAAPDAAWLMERYLLPRPRLALREALRAHARAAMDVSDGLAGDLAKMLRLTGLGADLSLADIPLSAPVRRALSLEPRLIETAISGGDDYEILCAAAPDETEKLQTGAAAAGVALTRIATAGRGAATLRILDREGREFSIARASYGHF